MSAEAPPLRLVQLSTNDPIPFDCGDGDLNAFFKDDRHPHLLEVIAVTYCLYAGDEPVAMYSLSNDRIDVDQMGQSRNKILRIIPFSKRKYKSYPAVKIGRLGVRKDMQGQGYGKDLMDFLKAFFLIRNKTGCRYLTVDAYPQSEAFYTKSGFHRLNPNSKTNPDEHILMYSDLMIMKKALDADLERKAGFDQMIRAMMN